MIASEPPSAQIFNLELSREPGAVDAPQPAAPYFFGSGLLSQDSDRRVVEYCLLDTFATIALKFRAEWTLAPSHGRLRWQPGSDALAGLLMLRLAVARETVVIASRKAEDSLLPIAAIEEARRVVEGQEFYENRQLRAHAPAACARMARAHAEALESVFTAFLVAARLHEVWAISEEARRNPPEDVAEAVIVPFPMEEARSFQPPARAPRPVGGPLLSRLLDPFTGRAHAPSPEGRPQ